MLDQCQKHGLRVGEFCFLRAGYRAWQTTGFCEEEILKEVSPRMRRPHSQSLPRVLEAMLKGTVSPENAGRDW